MDSMRSLNTSLPKTRRQPDVNQAFRTAALHLTNLYKSATADLERARADGYQEALEHLLGFLDRENIGVGDGEGWRIRQWATERVYGALPKTSSSDSDDEELDDKRARSSSPIMERNHSPDETRAPDAIEAAQRSDSAPPPVPTALPPTFTDTNPLHHVFQFSAPYPYPPELTNESSSVDVVDVGAAARRAFPPSRRTSTRSSTRNLQRSAVQNLSQLGNGAGQKRRLMQDLFNIDGSTDRRDGSSGGSKRGRMS